MEIWYRISAYDSKIVSMTVSKSTSRTVTLPASKWGGERREAIVSSASRYFPTEEKALNYLLTREVSNLAGLQNRLEECRECLKRTRGRIEELKK